MTEEPPTATRVEDFRAPGDLIITDKDGDTIEVGWAGAHSLIFFATESGVQLTYPDVQKLYAYLAKYLKQEFLCEGQEYIARSIRHDGTHKDDPGFPSEAAAIAAAEEQWGSLEETAEIQVWHHGKRVWHRKVT